MLELDAGKIRHGSRKPPVSATVLGSVTEKDLERLTVRGSSKPPSRAKLSHRHHKLARLLAAGQAPGEAAVLSGYEPTTVSILQQDEMFKHLVHVYKEKMDELFENQGEKLANISHTALDHLMNRLEDTPEKFTANQLMEMVKLGADRTGYGPSINQEVTHNINLSERLEQARLRELKRKPLLLEQAEDGR